MSGVVSTDRSFLAARPPGGPGSSTLPRLLVLTDRSQLRLGRGLVRTIAECVEAGLTLVVVREHDLPSAARTALITALVAVPGLTVISSRIADPRAHGFHLPAPTRCNAVSLPLPKRHDAGTATRTPRYSQVAERVGLGRGDGPGLLGQSCHSADDVRRAAAAGVDYVTLSPFAASPSKPGYGPALAPGAYVGHDVPVYALGGITTSNATAARDAGAHGVAVMGEVMRAADPAETVARLLEVVA